MAKIKKTPEPQGVKVQPEDVAGNFEFKTPKPSVPAVIEQAQPPAKVEPISVEIDKYRGVSQEPVSKEAGKRLLTPIDPNDVEIRPDGILYYPEIKYRRVLNEAIGPGGWALVPRSELTMNDKIMSREYALFVSGRFISESRGEQDYHENNPQMTYPSALEGVKSNALMRCCKDLGIASELWDPDFIHHWLEKYAVKVWVEGKERPQWRRKNRPKFYGERGEVKEDGASDGAKANPPPTGGAQSKGNGQPRAYQFTNTHRQLKTLIAGYIKENEYTPDYEGKILIRLTTWTDKDSKEHPGVSEWSRISEKMATYAIKRFNEAVKKAANEKRKGQEAEPGSRG